MFLIIFFILSFFSAHGDYFYIWKIEYHPEFFNTFASLYNLPIISQSAHNTIYPVNNPKFWRDRFESFLFSREQETLYLDPSISTASHHEWAAYLYGWSHRCRRGMGPWWLTLESRGANRWDHPSLGDTNHLEQATHTSFPLLPCLLCTPAQANVFLHCKTIQSGWMENGCLTLLYWRETCIIVDGLTHQKKYI